MRKIVLKVDRKHSALEDASITLDQGKQQMIFILLFTALYLLRDLAGASVPDIVFSGLCAVAFLLTDMGTALGMYIFTTTLTVPHHEIRMVYLVIILAKMFYSGSVQVNSKMLLMTVGLLFLQMVDITLFHEETVENVIYDYVTRMLVFVLPLFWNNKEYTAEDFRSALMCYLMGVLLGGTVTMILTAEGRSWEALLKGTGGKRLGKTYSEDEGMQTTYNANQLGIMFSICIAIILGYIEKKQIPRTLSVSLLGYSLFMIVLTRSRSALLMAALAVFVYIVIVVVRKKKLFTGILMGVTIAALVMAMFYFFPELTQRFLDRFVDQEDITNGRADLFKDYMLAWIDEPWCFFFGYGVGSYKYIFRSWNSPHNALTDILICWGLTGFLLVAATVAMCCARGMKKVEKKDRIMALLPAVIALVVSMAGQYLTTGFPHMRLCFLFLAAKAWEEDISKKSLK